MNWKFGAKGLLAVAAAFERLTGKLEPGFAATGFEQQIAEKIQARRGLRVGTFKDQLRISIVTPRPSVEISASHSAWIPSGRPLGH